jgi:hypothetical protein
MMRKLIQTITPTKLPRLLGNLVGVIDDISTPRIFALWAKTKADLQIGVKDVATISSYIYYLANLAEHRTEEQFSSYVTTNNLYINPDHIWYLAFEAEVKTLLPSLILENNQAEFIKVAEQVLVLYQGVLIPVLFRYEMGDIKLDKLLDGLSLVTHYKALQSACRKFITTTSPKVK